MCYVHKTKPAFGGESRQRATFRSGPEKNFKEVEEKALRRLSETPSSKISELPGVVAANLLDTDVIASVAGGITSKVAMSDLRTKVGLVVPAGRTSAGPQFVSNNASYNVKDYGAVLDGVADASTPIQTVLDSGGGDVDMSVGDALLLKPLLIKSGTTRVTMRGRNRIRSLLIPGAVDIKQAPQNVNAIIINQDNNSHFCMENLRLHGTVAFTGVGIYCKEGGGADASGQALFSGIFRNLWVSLASPNTGFLKGATNNCTFDTVTCESMKGIFTIEGVGNGDNFYRGFSLYSCYDQFILQTADTNGSTSLTVDGLHAYSHNRGRLFDTKNWTNCLIRGVILEPATGNAGDTGLFKFQDASGLVVNGFTAIKRTGVPSCAVGIEVNTTSAKFTKGKINADVALKIAGTGALDLEFEDVDFTDCDTYCMQIIAAATGTLRTRGCKFTNSQFDCMYSVANAMNWYSYDDEFLNAGLGGNASTRNLTFNSSGTIILTRPRIGRDNGAAAAAYFIAANGSGTVELIDPIWVGTPPTARFTGSQSVIIRITQPSGMSTTGAATLTVVDSDFDIIANRAGTVTLTLPSAASYLGRRLSIKTIQAQTVVSASANVVPRAGGAAGTAILAATAGAWAELVSDGTSWQIMSGS